MLLLFWRRALRLNSGDPLLIRWHHSTLCPPRCIIGASQGFSIINPYLYDVYSRECSWALFDNDICTAVDVHGTEIMAGSAESGMFKLDLSEIIHCDVSSPEDLTGYLEDSYTTASGLLSDSIVSVESQFPYLGIVTSSGLCWNKNNSSFVTYTTESGKDVFISPGPVTYLADGNSLRKKIGEPADFSSWDNVWEFTEDINDIWVNQKDGIDSVFVGTVSGAYALRGSDLYSFAPVISGSKNIEKIAVEYDSGYDWGHLFTMSSGMINVINLKHKTNEQAIPYSWSLVAFDTQRIYSK
jgi:hypothetical protein